MQTTRTPAQRWYAVGRLAVMALLALSLAPSPAAAQTRLCSDPNKARQRKSWTKLSNDEKRRFIAAVKAVMKRPSDGKTPSQYDKLVKIHIDKEKAHHFSPSFLPFHRLYLREFEMLLQKVDPQVSLPYWQSSSDYQAPEKSPVFDAGPLGFGGNGGPDGCVVGGAFAGMQVMYPEAGCLQRKWSGGNHMDAVLSPEMINKYLVEAKNFAEISVKIELGVHGPPHNNIGGHMASNSASPNDPIYWLHHAFVDMIWWQWQSIHPGNAAQYTDIVVRGRTVTAKKTDKLSPFAETALDVLDVHRLCYTYVL